MSDPGFARMLTQPGGLAQRLRSLRAEASMTGVALAALLADANPTQHWPDSSKITKIERGKQLPTEDEIRAWCLACGASEEVTEALVASRGRAETWKQRAERGMAAVQADYLDLYESTLRASTVEITTVPGIVQIEDYARCVLTQMMTAHLGRDPDPDDIDRAVIARLKRQELLYDTSKQFDILITEPVLHWQYAPPDVMVAQMDRLLTAEALSNVRLGIVPQTAHPAPVVIEHSFHVFDDLVIVETAASEYYHQADDEAAALLDRLDLYWQSAVEGEHARSRIIAAADQHRGS